MNQSEVIDGFIRCGWFEYSPTNRHGWHFLSRRNRELDYYLAPGYDYITVFRNGRIAEGILETGREKRTRAKRRSAEAGR